MKYLQKKFLYAEVTLCILTLIAGTFLHFLYEWTGGNYFAGLIAPVNESVWEHLKLLFFPVIFFSFFEYCYAGHYFPAFITGRTIGCFAGMLFIIVFYYTYTGMSGRNFLSVDILTYFAGVILCYFLTWYLTLRKKAGNGFTNFMCVLLLLFFTFLFFYFSNCAPDICFFRETMYILSV